MKTVFQKILSLLTVILGQWSWQPPQWIYSLGRQLQNTWLGAQWKRFLQFRQNHPKKASLRLGITAFAVIALTFAGFAVKNYLDSLPQPDYIEISVTPPMPTSTDSKKIDSLSLHFSKSAAKLEMIQKDVTELVEISPTIPGQWKWSDDKNLIFQPSGEAFKTDWLVGTEYQVKLNSKMFPSHLEFKSLKIKFKTPELRLTLASAQFYIDPTQPKNKKALLTVWSNHPLSVENFKKHVSLSYQSADGLTLGKSGTTLEPKITFHPSLTQAYIETDNLDIPAVDSVVEVTVSKGVESSRGGESTSEASSAKINVPGRYSAFKINEPKVIFARNAKYEPEQVFVFNSGIEASTEVIQKNLKVLLLPADHKPPGAKNKVKNYAWSSPSEVTEAIKKESTVVDLQWLPTENTYTADHSFKINQPVNRSLYIEVQKGIKGLGDYELGTTYQNVIRIPDYTPELMFMSQGSLLSLSGDRKLPLLARNVEKTQFKIGRVLPHQINFMLSKIFQSDNFKDPYLYDVEDMIMENFTEEQNLPLKSKTETVYFSFDLKPYIKESKGFFFIQASAQSASNPTMDISPPENEEGEGEESEGDMSDSSYGQERSPQHLNDKRLILVTDLGVIAKQTASGSTIVFVQNLRSGLPVESATVEVIGKNGLAFISQVTDSLGRVSFPKLDNYKNEKKPLAFVVKKNEDVSYLPYQMSQRQLNFSRFDVGGEIENTDSDQLSSMLFSDRGLYRPGDTVNVGVILRPKTNSAQIQKWPLILTVTDPRGTVIKKEKWPMKAYTLQDFHFATIESSPTGTYLVQLLLMKKEGSYQREITLGSTSVTVEEFVPDKLKINAQLFPYKTKGWVPLEKLNGKISLKNLFGSPAEQRIIKAEYTLSPVTPYLSQFKDYTFINPNNKDAQSVNDALAQQITNANGDVEYTIDLSKYQGYYHLRLSAEGFEAEGGRSVESAVTVYASQLKHLVGFKADGGLNYIHKDSERTVKLIAVDSDHQVAETDVQMALHEIQYVSSLVKQDNQTYKYQSIKKEKEISKNNLKISKSGASLKLPTDKPGQFAYIVKNSQGHELNRIDFNIIGEGNLSRSLDRNAELQLVLNKEDYKNGEEIELQIRAPYSGAGLITIERDTVYAQKWFKTSTSSTVEKIRIPEGLTGNAYINVTFLRDINSQEIYMSPLSFGVQPLTISLDQQKTEIQLKTPEKVRPGEKLIVKYSANRPTSLILYGVDEGILQVAKYKLPNPLLHFFRKRALSVETYQLLDLLIPEFSLIKEMSSTGGDMGSLEGDNLNPFKNKALAPVVFWSGVLNADTNSKTYSYDVPDYFNGSLKIMAVASSANGVGSTESSTFSRGDFIITPTLPIFITPSDEIQVGVSVSNQIESPQASSDVQLSLKTSSHVEVIGNASQKLSIPQGRESATQFLLKGTSQLGVAELQFSASNGTHAGQFKQSVSLRPATPSRTTLNLGMASELPTSLSLPRELLAEKSQNKLTVSSTPLSLSLGLIESLNDFPHGCTEQVVSQTIPSLVFMSQKEAPATVKKAKVAHDHLMAILRTRQTPQGGFSLYGHDNTDSPAASLYVAQYLIDAQEKGLETPEDISLSLVNYLKSSDLRKVNTLSEARLFAQALYLQARYGIVPTNDLNFLTEALNKKFKKDWAQDSIAVYMGGTYHLLQQSDKGWSLLKDLKLNQSQAYDYSVYYAPLVRDATLIQILSRHYPDKLKTVFSDETLKDFLKPIFSQNLNTMESAQVILAFASLSQAAEKKAFPTELKVQEWVQGQAQALNLPQKTVSEVMLSSLAQKVEISGAASMTPVFYSLTQKGFDKNLPTQARHQKIEASRIFENKDGKTITQTQMGDEVTVVVRLRGLEKSFIPYVVIVDLFPAGFELIRDSVDVSQNYIDKREDRLIIYTSASQQMQEFKYKLKATHKGRLTVPPLFAESMYDRSVQSMGLPQKMEIK